MQTSCATGRSGCEGTHGTYFGISSEFSRIIMSSLPKFLVLGIFHRVLKNHRLVKKPVVIRDEIRIREILNITAVFNHDVVDGAPSARFINRLRRYIETDYTQLLKK